jgi:hypothetical protein
MNARLTQHLVSIIAFAVIVGGCEYAVARESLRHADLHAWEINAKEFQGELPNVSWGPVRKRLVRINPRMLRRVV